MEQYCHLNKNNFVGAQVIFGGSAPSILHLFLGGSASSIPNRNCGSAPVRGAEVLTSV